MDKIQSSEGKLTLSLEKVPKALGALRKSWAPDLFIVSFKLETSEDLLIPKVKKSLENYGQNVVVANLLQTRFQEVQIISHSESFLLRNESDDLNFKIVTKIIELHTKYIE